MSFNKCNILSLILLTVTSTSISAQSSENYNMPKDVLSNGGDKAISSNYQMVATAGQYTAGKVQSDGMVLQTGFHQRRGVRDGNQCPNTVCYVTTDGNDETGNGSETSPFASIQSGIDTAIDGDTVLVGSGTYVENINFNGKNITVKSTDGAENTVIDGNKSDSVVQFINGETAQAILNGFTITNGTGTLTVPTGGVNGRTHGGGIWVYNNSSPTLKNLIVTGNSGDHGGGIGTWSNSNPYIENVLLTNNGSVWCSLGAWRNSNPKFVNVTIVDNKSCGIWIHGSKPQFVNSILWNNGTSPEVRFYSGSNEVTFSHSILKDGKSGINGNGTTNWLSGNLDTDPLFVNGYHLSSNSPAIDAGTSTNAPITDLEGYSRNNPDIGAYENISNSQVKLIATSNPSPICVGESFDVTFQTTPESQSFDSIEFSLKFNPTKLQANTITNSGVLDDILTEDINEGSIDFAAGVWDNEPPSGEFKLITINFTVLDDSEGIDLQFDSPTVTFEGETLSVSADDEMIITQKCIDCKVTLQGRPTPPDSRWETDLRIYVDGNQPYIIKTDNLGHCILPEAESNNTICVKGPHTLANRLPLAVNSDGWLDFGTLLEGDVDDDNQVALLDRSIIKTSKDKCQDDNGYIEEADLNEDNCVNTADNNLFKANYNKPKGDENPAICKWDTSVTPATLRRGTRDGSDFVSLQTMPIPANLTIDSSFDVAIKVNATQATDAVATYLNFDPQKLRVNHLTAGERFDDILENDFDNVTGHINFVAGAWENDLVIGEFVFVTINFTLLDENGEKTLSFNTTGPRQTEAVSGGKSVISEQRGEIIFADTTTIAPASCQLYAVNDKDLNDSQFFTMNLDDLTVSKLGPMYQAHDIESLTIHPETNIIYAASGDNTEQKGHLYLVDGKTGELFPVGNTGFKEIEDLAFDSDGTLWAWAKGNGLITIDPTTGIGTLVLASNVSVEGLTLSKEPNQTIFYGSVNTELWMYDMNANKLEVACTNLFGETEALEIMPDGQLLVGTHNVAFGLHAFNPQTCQVSMADKTLSNKFKDVEGIALPIAACSVCGDGIVQGNEQCEDGNAVSGDGCSDVCLTE